MFLIPRNCSARTPFRCFFANKIDFLIDKSATKFVYITALSSNAVETLLTYMHLYRCINVGGKRNRSTKYFFRKLTHPLLVSRANCTIWPFTANYVGPKSGTEFSTHFRPSFKTVTERSVSNAPLILGEKRSVEKYTFRKFCPSQIETNAMHSCVKLGTTSRNH